MSFLLNRVDDFIRAMDDADTLDRIFDILRKEVEALGFERFAYWLTWSPDGRQVPLYINSYPKDWINFYLDEKFGGDDMVMRYAGTQIRPYKWSDVTDRYELTKRQKLVFAQSAEAGLRTGAAVPINGPGQARAVFSVTNNESEEAFSKLFMLSRHTLHLIATYAHEKIIQLGVHDPISPNIRLSAREIEVLTWTARGKTRWEISVILGISEETVKTHLENACKRLGCLNKTHAIAVALVNGLILP